jgi:hypothetical protein
MITENKEQQMKGSTCESSTLGSTRRYREFEASLGYTVDLITKTKTRATKTNKQNTQVETTSHCACNYFPFIFSTIF